MKLVVCIKRTPDTTARIRIPEGAKTYDAQGIEWIINPYDELAIEAAIRIKEQKGGTAVGVSVDPDGNQTVMRKALAMGLDQGVVLQGGIPFDGFSVARALADEIRNHNPDLILFGKQAIDEDSLQVPSMVAELLGLARVNVVTKLEVGDDGVTAHRQIEGGMEVVELKFPCVVSCQRGLNEPRYPSLRGIMAAKKKPLEVKQIETPPSGVEVLGMEPPPPRPPGRIIADVRGKGEEEIRKACAELVRLLREEVKVL